QRCWRRREAHLEPNPLTNHPFFAKPGEVLVGVQRCLGVAEFGEFDLLMGHRAVRGERTNVEARHDDRLLAHSRETGGVIEHFPLEQDPVESLTYLAIRDPAHVLTQMSGHSAERLLSGISGY